MKYSMFLLLVTLVVAPGCLNEHQAQDRLQGAWVVDIEQTLPDMHKEVNAAKARNPQLDAKSLERDLTAFHQAQGFVISNSTIQVRSGEGVQSGTFQVVYAKGNIAVLREFYGTMADEMTPQENIEHLQMKSGDVPLHTGVHFIDDNHFRIFKLQVIDGKVTRERAYGYETFMREVETANRGMHVPPSSVRST